MRITLYLDLYNIVENMPDTKAGAGRYIRRKESWDKLEKRIVKAVEKRFPGANVRIAESYEPGYSGLTPDFAVTWSANDAVSEHILPTMALKIVSSLYFETLANEASWLVTEALPDKTEEPIYHDDDAETDWNEVTVELMEEIVAWFRAHNLANDKQVSNFIARLEDRIDGMS